MIEEKNIRYENVRGIPHLREPGNSVRSGVSAWRILKPVWDMKKCIKCKKCWLVCPDAAIKWKGKPVWDGRVCKGCLVCVGECPVNAIKSVKNK